MPLVGNNSGRNSKQCRCVANCHRGISQQSGIVGNILAVFRNKAILFRIIAVEFDNKMTLPDGKRDKNVGVTRTARAFHTSLEARPAACDMAVSSAELTFAGYDGVA
jgi:hypothetical protein